MAGTQKVCGILGIWLLFGGALEVSCSSVTIPQPVYKVARGDNATIPCLFTPPASGEPFVISWTSSNTDGTVKKSIVTFFNTAPAPTITAKYKGRATLNYDLTKGFANLQLLRVTSADTLSYECKVEISGDETDTQSASTNLIVLVAPSPPRCQVVGVSEYGQNITLTCFSEEGTPTPTYKWQSYDVTNVSRPNPPKSTDLNGVMSLFNVSKDTSGYFICTSTNEIRSANCNLTLSVLPPSMNIASTAGIIAAILIGVILLGIIIFCCCCRGKKESEEYTMGKRGEPEEPEEAE